MKHLVLGFILLLLINTAYSATLNGNLTDETGVAVMDAVISAVPAQEDLPALANSKQPTSLDQVDREFVPHVLAIRAGESVIFPNNDQTKHHVYSFSPANRFEIKLYSGVPSQPIVFNTPGVVVLGCNIHDWMVGYIVVADTPYFAQTDASGHWSIELPAGDYTFSLWHEDLDGSDAPKTIKVTEGKNLINDTVTLKRTQRNGKPPSAFQEQSY